MRTANNTNNYTVEGLVAKYRNFVKNSIADWQWELAKKAYFTHFVDIDNDKGKAVLCLHLGNKPSAPYYIEWDTNGLMGRIIKTFEGCASDREFIDGLSDFCNRGESERIKAYMDKLDASCRADYQLLAKLYCDYAQQNADTRIMRDMSKFSEAFKQDALYQEEYNFLCDHFAEVVSFEFSHETDWFQTHEEKYGLDSQSTRLSSWAIEYLKEIFTTDSQQTIYAIGAGRGEIAQCFSQSEVMGLGDGGINWALGQIQTYAIIGKHSKIVPFKDFTIPEKDSVDIITLDAVDMASPWWGSNMDFQACFKSLKKGGKMIIFASRYLLSGIHPNISGSRKFISKEEKAFYDFLVSLVKSNAIKSIVSTKMDCHSRNWRHSMDDAEDILLFVEKKEHSSVIVENLKKGKSITIKADLLDVNLLWPSFYMTKRPKDGLPLSSLAKAGIQDLAMEFGFRDEESQEEAIIVALTDLSEHYKDANLDLKTLQTESKGRYYYNASPGVLVYCTTEKLVVGYQTSNKMIIAQQDIPIIIPKRDIDARYLAALLLIPEVKEQIISICDGVCGAMTFYSILDKIIVPKHTPKDRFQFLAEVNYGALLSTQQELKKNHEDYKKAVRMRKHALTQSLSSIEAMFYALDAYRLRKNGNLSDADIISRRKGTTVKEAFEFIEPNLKNMMVTLEHIADVEYSFDSPQMIDPERFIEAYVAQKESGWLNFKPIINWKKGNNQFGNDVRDPETGSMIAYADDPISVLYFSKDAFKRVLDNVVANAIAHGFTDSSRNDYKLRFSWHTDGMNLVVVVENNGTAIPADRDTASLLEYGVSGALHHDGHNGIGCNEIDDIMRRYDGSVEIVSTPNEEYTVKYILKFKSNSNFIDNRFLGL